MVKIEEILSRTSSGIQVSSHGIPQNKMDYWNLPYGEDGRKPVQDLLWYPGEFPVQSWFSPHWNNWNQKHYFEFQGFNYIILNFVKKSFTCALAFSRQARPGKAGSV
jgi:hypothetical protein